MQLCSPSSLVDVLAIAFLLLPLRPAGWMDTFSCAHIRFHSSVLVGTSSAGWPRLTCLSVANPLRAPNRARFMPSLVNWEHCYIDYIGMGQIVKPMDFSWGQHGSIVSISQRFWCKNPGPLGMAPFARRASGRTGDGIVAASASRLKEGAHRPSQNLNGSIHKTTRYLYCKEAKIQQ